MKLLPRLLFVLLTALAPLAQADDDNTGLAQTYAASPATVFAALPAILKDQGLDLSFSDPAAGYVFAKYRSLGTAVQHVVILVRGQGSQTEVAVLNYNQSDSPFNQHDWDKLLLDALSQALGQKPGTGPTIYVIQPAT